MAYITAKCGCEIYLEVHTYEDRYGDPDVELEYAEIEAPCSDHTKRD